MRWFKKLFGEKNMSTRWFSQKIMKELAYSYGTVTVYGAWDEKTEEFGPDTILEVIHNEQCDTTRWNSVHDLVFVDKATGVTYHTRYEKGLTESQMLEPFYYDNEGVECDIVKTWEEQVTVLRWKQKQ